MFDKKAYKKKYRAEHREEISKYNKEYGKKRYEKNKEIILEQMKEYYQKNKDKIIKRVTQYYQDNKEDKLKYLECYRANNPEKRKIWDIKYRENNVEKIKEQSKKYFNENKEMILEKSKLWKHNNLDKIREYNNQKRKTDLRHNINHRMATAIGLALKGNKNGRHWENLVGYKLNELIKRLKKTMPNGYTWNDFLQGKLHIDHILPKRLFDFKEYKDCWNLYNLQLLTEDDNRFKKDNIINPILLGLLLKEMV